MVIINLNNLNGIPRKFMAELNKYDYLFYKNECLDSFIEKKPIKDLVLKINDFCNKNTITGFHYTRAIPEEIAQIGLINRTGKEIRKAFLSNWGNLFTQEDKDKIISKWDEYFDDKSNKNRDNKLFFNFTTYALYNGSAKRLLDNYGGEQVYMPIESLDIIGDKIKKIGKPLILKCKLNPKDINCFIENPWGKIAVATYHRLKNQLAYQYDCDGYQNVNVESKNIDIINFSKKQCYYQL